MRASSRFTAPAALGSASTRGLARTAGRLSRLEKGGFAFAAFLLIVASVVLPTGTVYGYPVKHAAYLLFFLGFVYMWIKSQEPLSQQLLTLLFFSASFVFLYMMIGLLQGIARPVHILSEAVAFFSTISMILLFIAATDRGWLSRPAILQSALFGAFAFSAIKVFAAVSMSVGYLNFPQVFSFVYDAFGYRFVSSLMFGDFVRVNLIIYDFFVLFVLSIASMQKNVFGRRFAVVRALFIPLGLACVFFAYSRLLFVALALAVTVLFVFDWSGYRRVWVLCLLGAVAAAMSPWLIGAVHDRFLSSEVEQSDELRQTQIEAILLRWSEVPILGGGFGYFSQALIRDPSAPHSYEVQWLGFLMKFGFVGLTFLLFLLTLVYRRLLVRSASGARVLSIAMVSVFFLGGFTNQYLVSSAAAVLYIVALILPEHSGEKHLPLRR